MAKRNIRTTEEIERVRFVEDPTPWEMPVDDSSWFARQFRRVRDSFDAVASALISHTEDTDNPHAVEHAQLDDNLGTPQEAHVPPGGAAGLVLTKTASDDYETAWRQPDINTKGELITGTGTISEAVNAYCFDGPDSTADCKICVAANDVLYVGYEGVVYRFFGPADVCVGSGGDYITSDEEWLPTGTTNHTSLTGRDANDSHPTSSITMLDADQEEQDDRLEALETRADETDTEQSAQDSSISALVTRANETDSEQAAQDGKIATNTAAISTHNHHGSTTVQVAHADLTGRYSADQHRIANVTDLEATLAALQAEDERLEDVKLDTADALTTFPFAAYLSMVAPVNTASPDIGAAWADIATPAQRGTPLRISAEANGQFSFDSPGVYAILVSGAFAHTGSQQGRTTNLRVYDYTNDTGGNPLVVATGRNAEATSVNVTTIVPIDASQVGHLFGFQMGGGDDYTGVVINTFSYSIFSVGLWEQSL